MIDMDDIYSCVGDGWKDILTTTFDKIEQVYARHCTDFNDLEIVQVKEKFGGLRIYTGSLPELVFDEVNDIIEQAEDDSFKTCEICGAEGKPRRGGWIKTLCDEHEQENKRH